MYLNHMIEVFYEDTDSLGMVYHANYLKYAERVRTLWLKKYLQPDALNWLADNKIAFVVTEITIKFQKPARLSEKLIVDFLPTIVSHAKIKASQIVYFADNNFNLTHRGRPKNKFDEAFVVMDVVLALIDLSSRRPVALQKKLPAFINDLKQSILENNLYNLTK